MSNGKHHSASECVSIRVARTHGEVETMRAAWERIQWHPNADIDYVRTIIDSRRELIRPHVILLERDGEARAMMIGRIADLVLRDRLVPSLLRRPVGRVLEVVHGGIVGDLSPDHCRLLLEEAQAVFGRREADAVFLSQFDVSSSLHELAVAQNTVLRRDYFPVPTIIRTAAIPRSYDAFLASRSKNTRRNLRRHAALIPDRFADQWSIEHYEAPDDVARLMRDAEHVAAKTYHRGMGTGFRPNDETSAVLQLAARRGWLRAYVLHVREEPCAFWEGLLYKRTYFTRTTGYNPAFREHHPGTFLLSHIFRDLCRHPEADLIDFGPGDAQYKRSYCDGERRTASLYLYAPTFRGVGVNLLRSASTLAHEGGRRLLSATHLWSRARRRWRSHLERRAA
jgi:hypothetical protein